MMERTHLEIARWLDVPVTAVAVTREVLRGTSAHSQRALVECGGVPVAAARWLAQFRGCYQVVETITDQVVERIRVVDQEGIRY